MNILLVGAMKTEVDSVKSVYQMTKLKDLKGIYPIYNSNNIYLLECFVGENNAAVATTLALQEYEFDLVIKIGCVGGTSPDLKKNDIILPIGYFHTGSWITRDFKTDVPTSDSSKWQSVFGNKAYQVNSSNLGNTPYFFEQNKQLLEKYRSILKQSGTKYVESLIGGGNMWFFSKEIMDHVKEDIISDFSESKIWCADMESYSIAHACSIFKIPFIGIYFVASSDYDDIDGYDPENIAKQTNETILPIVQKFITSYLNTIST